MSDETLVREFDSLEDAWNYLPEEIKAHSERVRDYMEILFMQASSLEIYLDLKSVARLRPDNVEIVKAMGLYHDLGKALVPAAYRKYRADFSPEEEALYYKHSADSVKLVNQLFNKDKKFTYYDMNYIGEGISSHHERFDGEGFPNQISGLGISLFSRMLAVADELDHIATEKLSEQPFEYACDRINEESGKKFDPEVVKALNVCKTKLKHVFQKNISQTRTIPVTETFIKRTVSRPYGLLYRPIMSRRGAKVESYEAQLFFRYKDDWVEYDRFKHIIKRENLKNDIGIYALLEACDTIVRFDTCKIRLKGLLVRLPGGWYNRRGAYNDVLAVLRDTGVSPDRLCVMVHAETWLGNHANMTENFKRLHEAGCGTMLADVTPDQVDPDELVKSYIDIVRFNADSAEKLEDPKVMQKLAALRAKNVMLAADGMTKKRFQATLSKCGIDFAVGIYVGGYKTDDEIVVQGLEALEAQGL